MISSIATSPAYPRLVGNQESNDSFVIPDALYAREISLRAQNRATGVFSNSRPSHAAIVMENIFRETRSNPAGGILRIYGKNLNGEISGFSNYRYELTKFLLSPNTKIQVIVDEEPGKDASGLNAFNILRALSKSEKVGSKINIRKVISLEKVGNLIQKALEFKDSHFAVSTENMYRLEIDSKLHFADCSFNDDVVSKKLVGIFDQMFNNQGANYTKNLT